LIDISILVIGSGSIGIRHAENLLKIVKEVKIFSSRFLRKENIKKIEKVVYVKDLYKEIDLSDGIIIANRTDKHLEIANYALRKKKNIFIEKPISHNMKGIKEIEDLANNYEAIIETGFMLRFHPNLLFLKKILDKKKYGRVHYVRSSVGQYLPDWRKNIDYKKGYAAKREWGGGVTLDLIHEIDLVRWLFGEVRLTSAMLTNSKDLEIETEAVAHINLKMQSEFLVQLNLDYVRPHYCRNTEIVCQKGVLHWDYLSGKIKLEDKYGKIVTLHEVESNFVRNDMFISEISNFVNNIVSPKNTKASDLYDAIQALRICCAAHLSNKKGQFISPDKIKYEHLIE
tara:strand:- start:13042 stop:14067 length:1026 start_codon:yes stop_codon:yes gene_type:complete